MKIIALTGGANTGKSHTINTAYSFLIDDGFIQLPGHFCELGNPKFEDAFDVLEKGVIKIGIVGMGDYIIGKDSLKALLQQMLLIGCDIVICSCRNNPKIEMAVTSYPNHILVLKTLSSGPDNHRIVNAADAAVLVGHI